MHALIKTDYRLANAWKIFDPKSSLLDLDISETFQSVVDALSIALTVPSLGATACHTSHVTRQFRFTVLSDHSLESFHADSPSNPPDSALR